MKLAALLLLAFAPSPALSIDDTTTRETNFDTVAVLTVTLAAASEEGVTVQYATRDGTADSTDYVSTSGTLTFAPGATTARVPVLVKGDALDEPDETFFVDLSSPEHAAIGRGSGAVTIVDDVGDRGLRPIVDAGIAARWLVRRGYTRVAQLRVTRAPSTASIAVSCAGKGCPFRFRTARPSLTRLFANARLRPGATVRITVDAPGMTGKLFSFQVRSGKPPLRTIGTLN
ncbi:MAG: Calx-beta domain-containing protein [Gaiellaceae bacterium]